MARATGKRLLAAVLFLIGVPLIPVFGLGLIPSYIGYKFWKQAKEQERRAEEADELRRKQLDAVDES